MSTNRKIKFTTNKGEFIAEMFEDKAPKTTKNFIDLVSKGFYDGFPGFVFSYFSAIRFPISYTKFWELIKTNRKIDLKNDWDKK